MRLNAVADGNSFKIGKLRFRKSRVRPVCPRDFASPVTCPPCPGVDGIFAVSGKLGLPLLLSAILLCGIVDSCSLSSFGHLQKVCTGSKDHAENVLLAIQEDLLRNPERGSIVPGLAGIRKARVENPARGKGKRGGFRYMYYFLERDEEIYLMFLFDKGEQEDLIASQKAALRKAVAMLKGV